MGIHIDTRQNFIYITFTQPFDKDMVKAVKRITGRRYIEQSKTWMIPVEQEPAVTAFYKKFSSRRNPNAPAKLKPVPDLPQLRVNIPLLRPLFPYQEQGVAACMAWERCIVGDQPGLGKTQQVIAACVANGPQAFPVLVICPNTLKRNWQSEWMTVAGRKAVIIDEDTRENWWSYYEKGIADVFIANDENLRGLFVASMQVPKGEKLMVKHIQLRDQVQQLIRTTVFDESHRYRNLDTQRAKIAVAISRGRRWIYAMTGTPIVNKTNDLIAQLALCWRLDEIGGIDYFLERYCKGKQFHPELQNVLRRTCFFQRAKSEVLKDLPAKTYQKVIVDITNRDEYNAAAKDLAAYLREYEGKTDAQVRKSMQGEVMVRIQKCRKIAARGKIEAVAEHADQFLAVGEKLVIFVYQRSVATAFLERYGSHAVAITGMQTLDQRNDAVRAFQTDPRYTVAVVSTEVGGVGITLTASSRPMFVETPWHAAAYDQCIDRTHRIGQENHVTAMAFLGFMTVDEQHYQLIEEKRSLGEGITGTEDISNQEVIDRVRASLFSGMQY